MEIAGRLDVGMKQSLVHSLGISRQDSVRRKGNLRPSHFKKRKKIYTDFCSTRTNPPSVFYFFREA